jgi:ABC-type Fe3+/spermidine/putrescine transport system ATPase subunit
VTHDRDEALQLSDRVAVMNGGRVLQIGAPRDVYERPTTAFVASFVGGADLVPGTSDGTTVKTSFGAFAAAAPGGDVVVACRPEQVEFTRDDTGPATVRDVRFRGDAAVAAAELPGGEVVRARVEVQSPLQPGDRVAVGLRTTPAVYGT